MKISEMSTEKAADVLVAICEPISNIAQDATVTEALNKFASTKHAEKPLIATVGEVINIFVPVALKTHKADLFAIVSALTDKSVDEICKQSIVQTMRDIKGSFDEDLVGFFRSAKQ